MTRDIDVVSIGESLGLLVANAHGRLQQVGTMSLGFGGAESNVAIGVARLGGTSAWVGRLGTDALSDLIIRELRAETVSVHAARDAVKPTAMMIKERPRPGRSRITFYRDGLAGSRLEASDIPAETIANSTVLHITGITPALGRSAYDAIDHAIDLADRYGTLISFDINHRARLWGADSSARDTYRRLAPHADVIFAGEDEAYLLTGVPAGPGQLEALRELGTCDAVIKQGDRGAEAMSADGHTCQRSSVTVPIVDTVGAGDAFVAGWLMEWVNGATMTERMETAVACGAAACTAGGDWESLPTREEIKHLTDSDDPVVR